jgi:hypothetical protein
MVECDCQVLITVVESSTVESAQWSDLIIGIKIVAQMLPSCQKRRQYGHPPISATCNEER